MPGAGEFMFLKPLPLFLRTCHSRPPIFIKTGGDEGLTGSFALKKRQ
jgi:hypothetical protein